MACAKTSWTTFYAVAAAIVRGLGITPTATNVRLMGAWMYAEHGNVGTGSGANPWNCWDARDVPAYNPIDSVLVLPGSQPINSVGVQAYTSPAQGIRAAVLTIQGGKIYPYANVIRGLAQSDPGTFYAADWGPISGGSAAAYVGQLQQAYASMPPVPSSVLAAHRAAPPPAKPSRPVVPVAVRRLPWVWIGLGVAAGVGAGWFLHTHPASFPRRVWRRYLG